MKKRVEDLKDIVREVWHFGDDPLVTEDKLKSPLGDASSGPRRHLEPTNGGGGSGNRHIF